jgi:RNA polymerase sigma-70 factor (ECF subfamily)
MRELLSAIARADAAALASFYERYSRAVVSAALAVVRDRAEAEEVAQEAFLRVWLRARSYDPGRGRAGAWLLRLTRHLALDLLRRRRLTLVAIGGDHGDAWPTEPGDGSANDVESEILVAERRRLVRAALRGLPATQREVIEHAYYGGLSQAEIAARLGLPLGTVKSRTSLGLRRLRDLIGGREGGLSATPKGTSSPTTGFERRPLAASRLVSGRAAVGAAAGRCRRPILHRPADGLATPRLLP